MSLAEADRPEPGSQLWLRQTLSPTAADEPLRLQRLTLTLDPLPAEEESDYTATTTKTVSALRGFASVQFTRLMISLAFCEVELDGAIIATPLGHCFAGSAWPSRYAGTIRDQTSADSALT